jgi:AAA domain
MTTLAVRAQEQAIERRSAELAKDAGRDVGEQARTNASREVAECIAAPLSREQQQALRALTGPERLAVLVGPAGTGKGVVIDAAARAEQTAGREVIGIAVSGSTAERLGADSPALEGRTLTLDALVARANTGRLQIAADTTVILDEAGMVDHKRLDALTEVVERSGAKLIAVGDGKQLPSIGPGGMFDRIAGRAPTAELADIHRTSDPEERKAWAALRAGEPERAMAHYQSRGQLNMTDTREQAGEAAVQRWASLTETHDIREVALIADASNKEIDRLNARVQHLRAERGELGASEVQLPHQHYGLREGDLIAFTKQHRTPGQPRVENGARGQVTGVHEQGLTVTLDGSERQVNLAGEDLEALRLGYAQHVYRQQGATVERSVVVTGGWQTSKESAYVQASRARQGTEWFLAREELGLDGLDERRVNQLADKMRASRAHTPSLEHPELPDPEYGTGFIRPIAPSRSRLPGVLRPINRLVNPPTHFGQDALRNSANFAPCRASVAAAGLRKSPPATVVRGSRHQDATPASPSLATPSLTRRAGVLFGRVSSLEVRNSTAIFFRKAVRVPKIQRDEARGPYMRQREATGTNLVLDLEDGVAPSDRRD